LPYFCVAASTKLLLNGQTPATTYPALIQSRVKRNIIIGEKLKKYKHGTGIEGMYVPPRSSILFACISTGVWQQYTSDLKLNKTERYIQSIVVSPTGALIFTFQPYLANLIHTADYIEVDTTFKRAFGEFNECEIVTWSRGVNRGMSNCS
jgi:hypothetical protein